MKKERPACAVIFILPLLALLCLGGLIGGYAVFSLPRQAAEQFGQPVSGLSRFEEIRLAAMLVSQSDSLIQPLEPDGKPEPFTVNLGESVPSVINRLQESGLIANPGAFRTYLQYAGLDTSIQAGEYQLSPSFSAIEIAQILQDATPAEIQFRILAGWRQEEIAASLPTSGLQISPDDFSQAARRRAQSLALTPFLPPGANLEGFFFPASYTLARELKAEELVDIFIERFDMEVGEELRSGFARQGLNLFQAVTLASIIEREAVTPDEGPLIASVFFNRLAIGMKLDADPTVQYALGYNEDQATWWTNPLFLVDLEIDSLYNTYRYPGLPPGPIANPGIEALRSVAFPAQTPYYYFRAACDGSGTHVFAETFAEHKANACP
jgi:UPF0755 protein